MLVEVCANSLQSALNAQEAGADRIELCSELAVGGVTPSYGLLKKVRELITIPVRVLIRPRSGDFTYSEIDFEMMKEDIVHCRELGFEGIVCGILKTDFTLDAKRIEELLELSPDMKFTFHRAFDWVKDPEDALFQLEAMGIDTVLTSGQRKSAPDGLPLLEKLHERSTGITVMPGGGIRPANAHIFKERNFGAIHLSGTSFKKTLDDRPGISMNSNSFLHDDKIAVTDIETIQNVLNVVK